MGWRCAPRGLRARPPDSTDSSTSCAHCGAPDGCPWDREQTLASLRPFVLEETYEVLEAIENGSPADLRDELGDYLFEVVFLAQISEEAGGFSITDAIDAVCEKLVRRHPHVFAREERDSRSRRIRSTSSGKRSRRASAPRLDRTRHARRPP